MTFGSMLIYSPNKGNNLLWCLWICLQQSTKTFPGTNPMGLGASCDTAYLETQQKEQSSVMFINQSPKIHQNISNLSNCLEANQCIGGDRWNHKTWHPCHNHPKTCMRIKSVCPVWIRTTENFHSHPRKRFRTNKNLIQYIWYTQVNNQQKTK